LDVSRLSAKTAYPRAVYLTNYASLKKINLGPLEFACGWQKKMRLVLKQAGRVINEFHFTKGPVYIGRHTNSQILLPDKKVSRQHAVIFATPDKKWVIEDLNSANKTYLNNEQIQKAQLKTGDRLQIAVFTIEVDLEENAKPQKPIHFEDTLITAPRKLQIIVRKIDVEHAPEIRFAAERSRDFIQATEAVCKANGPVEVLNVILDTLLTQFSACRVWCALRSEPDGSMAADAGKDHAGQEIRLDEIGLKQLVNQAVDKPEFVLVPQVPVQVEEQHIRSAMIAPIVGVAGSYGVVYVDNDTNHEPYTLADLDYLMLLAIHTAAILKNF